MSDREKKLALLVGILAVVGVAYLGYGYVDGTITAKDNEISQLESDVSDKQLQFDKGLRAAKKLKEFQRRSLPSDKQKARSDYPAWLHAQLAEVGIEHPQVTAKPMQARSGPFEDMRFEVRADADLLQVIKFFHRFYNVDDLHKVYSLRLDRDKDDSKRVELVANIDAAIIKAAPKDKQVGRPAEKTTELEKYFGSIAQRNPFGPANRTPQFGRIGTKRETVGRISFDLKANDDDKNDRLTYELISGPDGATLSESGKFSYRAEDITEHDIQVRVYDDGIPPKEDVAHFKLVVNEKPPEPPRQADPVRPSFDDAAHTVMVSTFRVGEKREVWLHVQTTGEMMKLSVGDDFKIGSISAVVARVGNGDAELKTESGRLLVEVGERLTQAEPIEGGI